MFKKAMLALALMAAAPAFGEAAAQIGPEPAAGVCNLTQQAVSRQNFRTQQAAQSECNALVAQTNANAADCKVVRLNNGRFQARFQLVQQLANVNLQQIQTDIQNFIQQFNVFANNKLTFQARAGNGCGG